MAKDSRGRLARLISRKVLGEEFGMQLWLQGTCIVGGSVLVSVLILATAVTWGPHHCAVQFPKIIGCALGSYEDLSGGLLAASAAVFGGWLAWSAVQLQISAEERRARADRIEVE